MRRSLISAVLMLAIAALVLSPAVARAQDDQADQPVPELVLYTAYPAQIIDVGESLTLPLQLRSRAAAEPVTLDVRGLPDDWSASFHGDGRPVQAVFVQPEAETPVELRVDVPAGTEPGTYEFVVAASGPSVEAELPVQVTIQEQTPASLAFEVDLPVLRGKPTTTFRFNVTLQNQGDEDVNVNFLADAPQIFSVVFKSGSQEVTSIPLKANASERLTVEVESLVDLIPAGPYPVVITARSEETEATTELVAEVVGEASMRLTTPDGRLSGQAQAGRDATFPLLIQNSGSGQARNIEMSASAPSGWTVTFEPEKVDVVEPGQQVEVTARVQPPEKTLAGDYMVTFRAQPDGGTSESVEYRVTVRTSTMWGAAGIGLVAVAVAVVAVAVMRFGRR